MKLRSNCEVLVMAKNVKNSADGKSKFYNLAVLCEGGEAGNVPCAESVYQLATTMTVNKLVAEYNDQYKSFKFVGVYVDGKLVDANGEIHDNVPVSAPSPAPGPVSVSSPSETAKTSKEK